MQEQQMTKELLGRLRPVGKTPRLPGGCTNDLSRAADAALASRAQPMCVMKNYAAVGILLTPGIIEPNEVRTCDATQTRNT